MVQYPADSIVQSQNNGLNYVFSYAPVAGKKTPAEAFSNGQIVEFVAVSATGDTESGTAYLNLTAATLTVQTLAWTYRTTDSTFVTNHLPISLAAPVTLYLKPYQAFTNGYSSSSTYLPPGSTGGTSTVVVGSNPQDVSNSLVANLTNTLSSTQPGKGAALIGIDATQNIIQSRTVEGALEEIASYAHNTQLALDNLESQFQTFVIGTVDQQILTKGEAKTLYLSLVDATANYANLESPSFVGIPSGPTAPADTASGQFATTAYVINQGYLKSAAASATYQTLSGMAAYAPIDTPHFTGVPTVPTANPGTNNSQIASTQYVDRSLAGKLDSTAPAADSAKLAGHDVTYFAVATAVASLDNPSFTGTPTAPTQGAGDNSNKLATTAYVDAAVAAGVSGGSGALSESVTSVAGNHVLSTGEGGMVLADATTGAITLTLPLASAKSGLIYKIRKIDTSANTVTVVVSGSDTIGTGGTSFMLSNRSDYIMLEADGGTTWRPFMTNVAPNFTGTPTIAGNAIATQSFVSTTYAPKSSPAFSGTPTAPTQTAGDNSTRLATTQYVDRGLGLKLDATAQATDSAKLGGTLAGSYALLASPTFTGNPTAVTQTQGDNSTRLATTAYVDTGLGTKLGATAQATDSAKLGGVAAASYAPLNAPAFTGNATAITQLAGDNSTKLATTAYVDGGLSGKLGATAQAADAAKLGGVVATSYALLASPAFSGTPTIGGANIATVNSTVANASSLGGTTAANYALLNAPNFSGTPTIANVAIATQSFVTSQGYAPLVSPNFTGTPTISNAAIATQSWVQAQGYGTGSSGSTTTLLATSIFDLRGKSLPTGNLTAIVQGNATVGDQGGGIFIWDAANSSADNGATIVNPTGNAGNGRWVRLVRSEVNVKWFGAKGDGVTDDAVAVQTAVNTGATVIFPAGNYVLGQTITASTKHLKLFSEESATITVNTLASLATNSQYSNTYSVLFQITGGADTNSRNYNLEITGLNFVCNDTTARAQICYAPGAFATITVQRNKSRGFAHFMYCGANYYTAANSNPTHYADAAITRFVADGNDIEYDGPFGSGQNGISFHPQQALETIITRNSIIGRQGSGYVLRVNGGDFGTVPTVDRGGANVKMMGNHFYSNGASEYVQCSKIYNVSFIGNTAHHDNAAATGCLLDNFDCFNVSVANNTVSGGGLVFFGHGDLNSSSYPTDLIGARSFTATGNTLINPTFNVFYLGGDGTVGDNRAGHNYAIQGNTVTCLSGFTPPAGIAFISSFLCNDLNVGNNTVQGLPRFIHSYFDQGYFVHDNKAIDVPDLVYVEGGDGSTTPTHAHLDNVISGTSGNTSQFSNINPGYVRSITGMLKLTHPSDNAQIEYAPTNGTRFHTGGRINGDSWYLWNDSTSQVLAEMYGNGHLVLTGGISNSDNGNLLQVNGSSSFLVRPTFNGNTPWDSGNFTPANYALLASPNFSGTPQIAGTNIAKTTDIPSASITTPVMDGTAAVGTGATWARADHVHPTDTSRAPLASPNFSGTPQIGGVNIATTANIPAASSTTPAALGTAAVGVSTTYARSDHVHALQTTATTQTQGNNSTSIATTAYVDTGLGTKLGATAQAADSAKLGGTAAASYALLASPIFSGTPTAPTAAVTLNNTQLATTAFVQLARNRIGSTAWAATWSPDPTTGEIFNGTATANFTLNPLTTGAVDGQRLVIRVTQDATGSRLITWGANIAFGTDIPSSTTLTTTASKTDVIGLMYSSSAGKWWLTSIVKGF